MELIGNSLQPEADEEFRKGPLSRDDTGNQVDLKLKPPHCNHSNKGLQIILIIYQ